MLKNKVIRVNKKLLTVVVACAVFAVAAVMFVQADRGSQRAISAASQQERRVFIIDAGHGGADGGAVSGETVEKDINLEIALRLRDFLRAFGCTVIMTRAEDRSVHSPEAKTVRQQKVSDIHNRTDLVNNTPGGVLISIHQNKFPGTAEHGLQVFYSPNDPESGVLAQCVQDTARALLAPENDRKTKKSGNNIYLLTYAKAPAVMVECGFLSNPAEREKLKTREYQEKLAFAVAIAAVNWQPAGQWPGEGHSALIKP